MTNNNNNVNDFDFDNIEFTLLDGWANQTSGTRVSLVKNELASLFERGIRESKRFTPQESLKCLASNENALNNIWMFKLEVTVNRIQQYYYKLLKKVKIK